MNTTTYPTIAATNTTSPKLKQEVIDLLQQLISTPSFSREENEVANLMEAFLSERGLKINRKGNNVWVRNDGFEVGKYTILLNSHLDTVKPVKAWTLDPFEAKIADGKLYGLGSNDAGGALVSLLATFLHFNGKAELPFNLVFAASAEEEISGSNGVASIIEDLGKIDLAIVGEPTQMQMAVAEKGLMVLDCMAEGIAGHAAREEGVNAIYKAMQDIERIQNFEFPKKSNLLGVVKLSVTQINAGYQHNVVPDQCSFVVDVRTNEFYSNAVVLGMLSEVLESKVTARSLRLNSSGISLTHPIVKAGKKMGLSHFGSPTLSDQALMPFKSIKIGPGKSARSHTANEFIYLEEIEAGIDIYIELLETMDGG
ncbi:MAG: M20 family metallo-hydrolase [Chitinophagales bacterium]